MELVYLWVEDYKNIKKQGFNFSPRFECKYENNELTICDKKRNECKDNDYIENFFGDNINVTAIVGKNGSGKSSVLNALIEANDTFFSFPSLSQHKFILIYKTIEGNFIEKNFEINYNKEIFIDESTNINFFHYDNSLYYFQRYKNSNDFFVSIDGFSPYDKNQQEYTYITLKPNKDIELKNTSTEEEKNIIFHMTNKNTKDKIIKSFFEPTIIFLNSFDNTICDSCTSFQDLEMYSLKKYLKNILEKMKNKIPDNQFKEEENTILIGNFPLDKIQDELSESKNINDLLNIIYNKILPINGNVYINSIEPVEREIYINIIKKLKQYIEISQTIQNKNELIYNENNFFKVKISLLKKNNIDFFLSMKPFINVSFFDEKRNLNYEFLSNGEKEFLKIRFYIDEVIKDKKLENKKLIILLDEPNNHLHPEWQKKFLDILISYLKENYKNIYFHLIFTTHSPFLLSDIPKQNLILLDKYDNKSKKKYSNLNLANLEDGNCINVSSKIDIKPFGANIHELLSHGFFMEDGLIGKFAKNKIQEVINFLNEKESPIQDKNTAKQIINIVGEPFLQMQLRKMYNQKFSTESEIDKQINELKRELERLEDAKNRNK